LMIGKGTPRGLQDLAIVYFLTLIELTGFVHLIWPTLII